MAPRDSKALVFQVSVYGENEGRLIDGYLAGVIDDDITDD